MVLEHATVEHDFPKTSKVKTLIVVEDVLISRLVRTVLQKQGYTVIVMDRASAEDLFRSEAAPSEILLTNLPEPFLEFGSSVPRLYLTSAPDPDLEACFRACRVVRKPFVPQELVAAVNELADRV